MRLFQKITVVVLMCFITASCSSNKCKEYASHLVELAGNTDSLPYRLSPNGRWLTSDSSVSQGQNIFITDTLIEGNRIQIDTKTDLPEDYLILWGTEWSCQHPKISTTW